MAIPFQETDRTQTEHAVIGQSIWERDDIYSCIFKFSSKENFGDEFLLGEPWQSLILSLGI